MKKSILLCALIAILSGCVSQHLGAPAVSLEAAIRAAARQMDSRLSANTKVAIVSVGSSSARLSEYIINQLEAVLVNSGKLVVVDRANLDKIREEQGFQLSGYVSDESAKAIGQHLGAGAIVTGSFTDLGDVCHLTLKAINMETAAVVVSYPSDIIKSTRIENMLASGGGGTDRRSTPDGSGSDKIPAGSVYKIGDKGPAGGIIFYDKGNNSGGWRYLEAAPASTERELVSYGDTRPGAWAGAWHSSYFDDTQSDQRPGEGKQTTRKMMEVIAKYGGGINTAPWYCDGLVLNGFDDWYLPAIDELLLMYANLHSNNLGDFKSRKYWSSNGRNVRRGVDFSSGEIFDERGSGSKQYVRACRQF